MTVFPAKLLCKDLGENTFLLLLPIAAEVKETFFTIIYFYIRFIPLFAFEVAFNNIQC